mgnify:CR=1 FL=1
MTKRWFRSTVAVIAVLGLTTLASAATPAGNSLLIGVWDADGDAIVGAQVSASVDGVMAKGIEQGAGYYMLPAVGTVVVDGVKVNVEISHPVWGTVLDDLLFEDLALLRLDVSFDAPNSAQMLSPQMIEVTPSAAGGDGVSNDDCSGAISVGANSSTNGSTTGATIDGTEACGTAITAPGVWYTVVGTGNSMTASTCGPFFGYDTKVTVYCGSCDDLTCLAGNDDNCIGGASGLLSTVTWCSQAGADYYILVHGFSSGTGDFTLNVSDGGSCTGAVPCLPPVVLGACCFDDGSCDVLSADDCDAAGGSYQGDDTACFAGGSGDGSSAPGAGIPDNNPAGITDVINIGNSFSVTDVTVDLNVTHTWQGDIIATLSHGATTVTLMDRPGVPASTFGCSDDDFAVSFVDGGPGDAENDCPVGGSTNPLSPLSAFAGADSAGAWTLSISDNAGGDTGTLDSWSISIGGGGEPEPICEQPECYLVIGDGQGVTPFVGSNHLFNTQVGPAVEEYYPVLMEDIPSFLLPPVKSRMSASNGQGFAAGGLMPDSVGQTPEFMTDGEFTVQVIMWNPDVFPQLPEQFSVGVQVQILTNGRVIATPYGEAQGLITIETEITEVDGKRYISFPFQIEGF